LIESKPAILEEPKRINMGNWTFDPEGGKETPTPSVWDGRLHRWVGPAAI